MLYYITCSSCGCRVPTQDGFLPMHMVYYRKKYCQESGTDYREEVIRDIESEMKFHEEETHSILEMRVKEIKNLQKHVEYMLNSFEKRKQEFEESIKFLKGK